MKKVQQILTVHPLVLKNWKLEVTSLPYQKSKDTDNLWYTGLTIVKDTNPYTKDPEKPASNKFEKLNIKTHEKPDISLEDIVTIVNIEKAVPYSQGDTNYINGLSITAETIKKIDTTVQNAKEKGQGIFA